MAKQSIISKILKENGQEITGWEDSVFGGKKPVIRDIPAEEKKKRTKKEA